MDNQGNATCCSNDQVYVISYAERQTLAAVGIIVSFLGIIGNTLVIAAVILSKKLRTTTNVFILNLSVADLLTCGFVLPLDTVAMLGNHWPLPIALCKLAGFVAIVSVGASSNSMAFIAANRYILVTKSMSTYRRCFSRNKTLAAVVFIWLFSMTVAIVPQCTGLLKLGYQPRFSSCAWSGNGRNELDLYFFAMFYLVQCGCISWSYAGIAYHTYNHTRKVQHLTTRPAVAIVMDAQNQQRGAGHQPAGNKLQMEVTKNLFLLCESLLVWGKAPSL
ncbi:melatonin receptor type 1A-like [Patiria miniata]|uniref:G-protein coupled receptors family 1 profile domain-containing protein n=1 Tax=Patiria miniata TaxID=46514 RepID=A0A913Z8Q7_PATMI|nr:melatonin receptor type 1A-like [Patiria miniata]